MAALLQDERVQSRKDIEAAFAAFDANRRERSQWLVQSSRFIGDCYEWRAPGIGNDFKKIEHEINTRNAIVGDFDMEKMCRDCTEELTKALRQSNL